MAVDRGQAQRLKEVRYYPYIRYYYLTWLMWIREDEESQPVPVSKALLFNPQNNSLVKFKKKRSFVSVYKTVALDEEKQ